MGIRTAQEQAAKLGVKLNTELQSIDEFDIGKERWDLIVGMYMHGLITQNAARIRGGLRAGGLLVVEGFHRDVQTTGISGDPLGYETNELLKAFQELRILRYEDTTGIADWGDPTKEVPVVRLLAQKQ